MDRLRALLLQLRDFFAALPPGRRVSFLALTAAVLGATIGLAWWVGQPSYRLLYADLGPSDAGAVIDYLKSERIPYRVGAGGSTVEVSTLHVHEARMALAAAGIPRGGGGVGFEIFDTQTLGMTDFVQRLNYQRALQGELARTIMQLDAVEAARVHLALPERSLFVAEERRPSASAVLKLRGGRTLAPDQVAGVVHLIAASVEGLHASEVTVVDVDGKVLTRDLQEAEGQPIGKGLLAFQRELEHDYAQRIETMLERVLGPGHALARVTLALDLSQVERTEESFDPDRVAVRNEKRSRESNSTGGAARGVPGVTATLTNEPAVDAESGPTSEREDSALSYEISKTTSHRIDAMGAIEKLTVAVMLDGTWEGEGEERTFMPRSAEEIGGYTELIKRAVGFDEDRGDEIEVASVPFQETEALAPPEAPGMLAMLSDWSDALWRAAGLAVVLVIAFTVVRPFLLTMARRAPVGAAKRRAEPLALPEAETPQTIALQGARNDPEHTAAVIRQWLQAS